MRTWLVMLVALSLSAPTHGQSAGEYLEFPRRYVDDPDAAIQALATWPERPVSAGVAACIRLVDRVMNLRMCSERQRIAAAMLHTDVAAAIGPSTPTRAAFHMRQARMFVDTISHDMDFAERWYEFATDFYLGEALVGEATNIVNHALTRFENSARLWLARGMTFEVGARYNFRNLRRYAVTRERMPPGLARALHAAAADYRRALDVDPRFVSARLRLAWTQILEHDSRAAAELTSVVDAAENAATRYLAHLFLGTIAEQKGALGEAATAYAAARQAGPRYQTACLALSHVEEALGHADRAATIGLECLALNKDEDPWWYYQLGAYEWSARDVLRAEARRP